jgi:hypothetical protein
MSRIAPFRALACHVVPWWGKRRELGAKGRRRQDKSGSPVASQAIDMAWLSWCRTVGSRAAIKDFFNNINAIFGTNADFDAQGSAS